MVWCFIRATTHLSALFVAKGSKVVIISVSEVLRLLVTCGCTLHAASVVGHVSDTHIGPL